MKIQEPEKKYIYVVSNTISISKNMYMIMTRNNQYIPNYFFEYYHDVLLYDG